MTITNREEEINSFINALKEIGVVEYQPKKVDLDNKHFKFWDYELFSITVRELWDKHKNAEDYWQINMKRNELAKQFLRYFNFSKSYFPEFSERYPRKQNILDYLVEKKDKFMK